MATDQQVDELIRELKEFVDTLDKIQRSQAADFNRAADRMIAAMALMTRTLDQATRVKKQESKYVEEFTKKVQAATKATEEQTEVTKERTQTEEEIAREARKQAQRQRESARYEISDRMRQRSQWNDYIDTFGRGITVTGLLRQRFEDLGGSSFLATTALRGVTAGLEVLAKATTLYGSALYKGERGAAVTAKAFTALTTPLADLATTVSTMIAVLSFFGPAGLIGKGLKILGVTLGALGISAKVFNKVNELGAEQADKLFNSFRALSEVGAAGSRGLDDVFDMMQSLGMTVAEIDKFNELIKQNAQTMGFFGAGAARGGKEFAKVAGTLYKSRLGEQLELLGLSAEEQREAALAYMHIQAKTGQMQLKNTDQLVQESGKFAKELDLAAQLTGQTRREQAKAQEQAMTEERFRQATIAARARGDQQELARLERFRQAAAVVGAFDPAAARGILQAGAGRGALTTPEAVAAEMTFGFSKALNDPSIPITTALGIIAENAKRTTESLAPSGAFIGTIKGIQTDIVGIDNFVQRMMPIINEATKQGITVEEFLKTEQGQRMAQGGATKLMTEAGRNQQAAALIMDKTVNTFNAAAQIHAASTQVFKSAVEKLAGTVGVKSAVPTVGGSAPTATGGDQGGVTTSSGPRVFRGGIMGGLESFITQGRGFRSYSQQVQDVADLFDFRGGVTGNRENLDKLEPGFRDRLTRMAAEYNQLTQGKKIPFGSGQRSQEQNAQVGGVGTSLHMEGRAADLSADVVEDLKKRGLLDRYGFKQNPRSGWHISDTGFRQGGIAQGPKSGYLEVLHGTEAIVPLPDGKSIPVELPDFATGMGRQMDAMQGQISRLDELINLMSRQVNLSSKILQAANN